MAQFIQGIFKKKLPPKFLRGHDGLHERAGKLKTIFSKSISISSVRNIFCIHIVNKLVCLIYFHLNIQKCFLKTTNTTFTT